jgi:hypothetical protein
MSYYYEDPDYDDYSYEYVDDGNHGDDGYEPYSDEPDHWEIEPEGLDHEAHECEPDWDAFERAEIEYGDRGGYQYETEAEGYPEVPEYEGDNAYQHDDDARVFAPADHDAVEPRAPSDTMYVPAYPMPVYTHPNSHLPTPTPIPRPHNSPNLNQRGHVTALEIHACAFNDEHDDERAFANVEHPVDYPTATSPPLYTYLDTLRRDFDNGIPSAVAFMRDLQEYTEECLYEHSEWKADERAEIRRNHNIAYPKRDYLVRPRSWDAPDEPADGLPHTIEGSRPLRPGLKRRRYKNSRATHSRATYYRTSQPRPPLEPEEGDVAPATPPHPTTLRNGHHNNNNGTDKSPHHFNARTTPYSTSRSRPPPWPIKNSNKNRNKYYYGTHTPTDTTAKRRPPPWPIIPTPTTILSIAGSRPPPWPIICHCQHNQHSPVSTPPARPPPWPIIPRRIQSTPQNRRNAKQRIKAKSRFISEEVSV